MEEWKFRVTLTSIRPLPLLPTLLLIAANVAMYVYTSWLSGSFVTTSTEVLAFYGQWNLATLNGYYWQLVSSMFVHVNMVHIASNMLFLFIFGLRAEELFSTAEYYLVYFSSGLAGNLLTLLEGPNVLSAGASGAIMGVFGANVIFMRRTVGQPVLVSLMFAFMFLLLTTSAGTNLLAHLGGLVAGLLLGYAFAGTRKFERTRSRYAF